MTTGNDMVDGVRTLLHDTGRGFATTARFFQTEEILRRLNESKWRVANLLAAMPEAAWVPLSRLVKYIAIVDQAQVPDAFYDELAALDDNGRYVPVAGMPVAEPLRAQGHEYTFVRSGAYNGPNGTMYYRAWASEVIDESSTPLTEFSDGVYFLIQLLAARELLPQEKSDALDRWKLLSKMMTEEMMSFGSLAMQS